MTQRSYDAALFIVRRLRDAGCCAYFAGGCVRDQLLGVPPKDYDVATDAPPDRVTKLFNRTRCVGAKFGVVLVRLKGVDVEVATFRTEGEYTDGRRPERVEFTTAENDARRRDFTINGMFFDPLDDTVIDLVGGREDIDRQLIRCIGEPAHRFQEDHLRMLRAVRFAARLGFVIEPETWDAMCRHAARIEQISPERIRMELELILSTDGRAAGWGLLERSSLLEHCIPSVPWSESSKGLVQELLMSLPSNTSLAAAWAAIWHPFDAEEIERACRDLRCSNEQIKSAQYLHQACMRLKAHGELELADVKLMRQSGRLEDLLCLLEALEQIAEARPNLALDLKHRAEAIPAEDVAPPPLVTGDDLKALGVPQGPHYARCLSLLYREQLNETLTDREAALAKARRLLSDEGF